MAGLAETCSHVGAILHWVETAVRIRNDTPCTSKENKWIIPTPTKSIPCLVLHEIDFGHKQKAVESDVDSGEHLAKKLKVDGPSSPEKQSFFEAISNAKKKPVILSITEGFNDGFVHPENFLPRDFEHIYEPANLSKSYDELLALSENFLNETISESMVDNLAEITKEQSGCKQWFRYRTGRITASNFKQVVHTSTLKPSVSILKKICYPKMNVFTTSATRWGRKHEKTALEVYKCKMNGHPGFSITKCGLPYSTKYWRIFILADWRFW